MPFNGLTYTTKDGDSLSGIAARFGLDIADIAKANSLEGLEALAAGVELFIPQTFASTSYLIGRGGEDEVAEVSEEAATDESDIEEFVDEEEAEVEEVNEDSSSSGWTHPAPGALITQSSHGSSGGVDFGAPVGTTVVAADGGTVTKASAGYNGGYGTVVEIDHHDGTTSRYAHLSSLLVSTGETVSAGQAIGYIGLTGKTTGPHLHFEIHGGSNPFSSCGYLSRCGG